MSRAWKRPLGSLALAGFVVFLGFAAAGCGSSGGDGGSSATEIPGLGSSLDEIKQKARDEGEVDIVQWAGGAWGNRGQIQSTYYGRFPPAN